MKAECELSAGLSRKREAGSEKKGSAGLPGAECQWESLGDGREGGVTPGHAATWGDTDRRTEGHTPCWDPQALERSFS